jgi:hypothetical protein
VLFASVAETVALVGTHKENMSNINAVDWTPLPPRSQRRLGKPCRSEGCHAVAHQAKGAPHASYGSANHASQPQGRCGSRSPTKISKTTPCTVAWRRWHGCFTRENILTRPGKSPALFHHRAICRAADGAAHRIAVSSIHSGSAIARSSTAFTVVPRSVSWRP